MKGPHIDWAAISPLVALTVGACLVLMAGLLRPAFVRTTLVPGLTIVTLGVDGRARACRSGARTRR